MSLADQTVLVLVVTGVLYIVPPLVLIWKGRFLVAGLVGCLAAFLPSICHALLWPQSPSNSSLLLVLLLPLPIMTILVRLVVLLIEFIQWVLGRLLTRTV